MDWETLYIDTMARQVLEDNLPKAMREACDNQGISREDTVALAHRVAMAALFKADELVVSIEDELSPEELEQLKSFSQEAKEAVDMLSDPSLSTAKPKTVH